MNDKKNTTTSIWSKACTFGGCLTEVRDLVVDAIVEFFKEGTFLPMALITMTIIYVAAICWVQSLGGDTNKALLSVFITTGYSAWLTFLFSQAQSARTMRKSHTLTLLMQSREAPNYLANLKLVNSIWNGSTQSPRLSYEQYQAWRGGNGVQNPSEKDLAVELLLSKVSQFSSQHEEHRRKEMTHALNQLINYYEFLALGIIKRIFDERILKETIRGIFCNFVFAVQDIIRESRENDNNGNETKTWENIVFLYYRWETDETRLTSVDLGPRVSPEIVNVGALHGFARLGIFDYDWILKRFI